MQSVACTAVGSVLSKKDSWIAHLIGGKAPSGCQYASAEAKADASGQRSESKKRAEPDTAGGTGPPHKKQQRDLTPTQSTLTGFRRNEMPYGEAETDVIQRQALRAIVSGRGFRGPRDAGAGSLPGMVLSLALSIPFRRPLSHYPANTHVTASVFSIHSQRWS
ncbi:hypothetical protein B0H10DRAFT_1955308 [Mycena sp. CBHHK59/15]|nr:hypothetical protein B0H10DRAFT_1955308 [Mycena sp. CBHHK59/15]